MTLEAGLAFLGLALLAYVTPWRDWFVIMGHTSMGCTPGLISALGTPTGLSRRIKARVRASLPAQVSLEGRWLGGWPSYGYMLGDAGSGSIDGRCHPSLM